VVLLTVAMEVLMVFIFYIYLMFLNFVGWLPFESIYGKEDILEAGNWSGCFS
jgi:hypothetical protein